MPGLKQRAKAMIELAESAVFYCHERPIPMADKAKGLLEDGREHVVALAPAFAAMGDWTEAAAEPPFGAYIDSRGVNMGEVAGRSAPP